MKKLLLFLLGFELLLGQTTVNGGRQFLGAVDAADSSWVRIKRGPGAPPAAECATADAVGRIYARSDAGASNATFYVCANTGAGAYGWELAAGGGGSEDGAMKRPSVRRWSIVTASGSGTNPNAVGTATTGLGSSQHTYPDDSVGLLFGRNTGTTVGTNAGHNSEPQYRTTHNPHGWFDIKISSTTDIRTWIGFSNTWASILDGDDPSNQIAAFRYSTSAGDATWRCVTKDGSTATIKDSGVPPTTTATQKLEIEITGGTSVVFRINGSTVCTNTANLPSGTLRMNQFIRNLAAENKQIDLASIYIETDK